MRIIGHGHIRERLRKRASQPGDTAPQPLLFFGPGALGKGLVALEYAAALVGEHSFVPTETRPHPADVYCLAPEEETKKGITKRKNISVEALRDAVRFLASTPTEGARRVLLIRDAELLSAGAANALLKTLEEPPENSVVLLTASERGRLFPTLLSRMEQIRFSLVSESELERAFVSELGGLPDQELISFLYTLGRPGLLVAVRNRPEFLADIRESLGTLFRLPRLGVRERLEFAEKLSGNVPEAVRLLEWWLPGLHVMAEKRLKNHANSDLYLAVAQGERTLGLLKTTQANARLQLEKLFLGLS